MLVTEDLSEAAEKAVKMAAILRMARDARISINLTSWLLYADIYISLLLPLLYSFMFDVFLFLLRMHLDVSFHFKKRFLLQIINHWTHHRENIIIQKEKCINANHAEQLSLKEKMIR